MTRLVIESRKPACRVHECKLALSGGSLSTGHNPKGCGKFLMRLCARTHGAQDRQEPRRRTPYMAALYNLYRYIVQHLSLKRQPLIYADSRTE
jgi:hypothetical protein